MEEESLPVLARMFELLTEASDAAAARREASMGKMRAIQAAEAEREAKAKAKEGARKDKKRELVASFKEQQAAAKKAAKALKAPPPAKKAPAAADGKRKKVSFGGES